MRVRVLGVEPFTHGMVTRLPHVFLRLRLLVDGVESVGLSSEGLLPKWFTKDPERRFEDDDLPVMVGAIYERAAADEAPLLAHLGTSLVERGMIDAYCRGVGSCESGTRSDRETRWRCPMCARGRRGAMWRGWGAWVNC